MDFTTRNEYRTQIELLARGSDRPEIEVAREALLLARKAGQERPDEMESELQRSELGLPGVPERAEEKRRPPPFLQGSVPEQSTDTSTKTSVTVAHAYLQYSQYDG